MQREQAETGEPQPLEPLALGISPDIRWRILSEQRRHRNFDAIESEELWYLSAFSKLAENLARTYLRPSVLPIRHANVTTVIRLAAGDSRPNLPMRSPPWIFRSE